MRVRIRDLKPGDRYFAVYSPTGVCIYRTRYIEDARRIEGKGVGRVIREHSQPFNGKDWTR